MTVLILVLHERSPGWFARKRFISAPQLLDLVMWCQQLLQFQSHLCVLNVSRQNTTCSRSVFLKMADANLPLPAPPPTAGESPLQKMQRLKRERQQAKDAGLSSLSFLPAYIHAQDLCKQLFGSLKQQAKKVKKACSALGRGRGASSCRYVLSCCLVLQMRVMLQAKKYEQRIFWPCLRDVRRSCIHVLG